jgi:outer membrane protein OmpA-like peptidoglycan-associated protein
MKKLLLLVLASGLFFTGFCQDNYKKRPALGVAYIFNDFQTASDLRNIGLTSLIKSKQWHKTNRMNAGLAVNYLQGLSSHVDVAATLSGSFVDYPVPGKPLAGKDALLLEAAVTGNLKLTTDRYWVSPFLSFGVGASKYKGYYAAILPVGVGLQVNFWDDAYLLLNSQYRVPITENAEYHFFHSIGIAGTLKKKEPAPVVVPVLPVVEAPKDRDGDGVLDVDDKCPDVKGLASLKGCPDRDGDGIADDDDACPDKAGTAKYKGCPIPDTDGDGINDELDKCPIVAGLARYNGCPIPDTDNDGVNDEEDKCPNVAGPATNFGCPEIPKAVVEKINYAAKNIFFATGSAKLLAKSFKSLNEVAKIMDDDQTLKLNIDGHTDNTGTAAKNQTLSESRAASVLAYLKSKGVDEGRMTATGFGQDKPVADNKTAAGRAKNRRVELVAHNY